MVDDKIREIREHGNWLWFGGDGDLRSSEQQYISLVGSGGRTRGSYTSYTILKDI